MALPQQVINQLAQEKDTTTGWSVELILFCAGLLVLTLLIYVGISFAYEPYLNSQYNTIQSQIATLGQSISSSDQAKLITFYSQISNLQSILAHHVISSQFLTWLEQNTDANVQYTQFALIAGDEVTLVGAAPNEADINEQIAVFEASPEVKGIAVSNVQLTATGLWQFTASLTMQPSLFLAPSATASSSVTGTTSTL
jgi:hypothetical protein